MNSLTLSAEKALLMVLGSVLYTLTHLTNIWLFDFWEVTPNISWIYLPSFVRLANLLVLGPLWGTFATALGGTELILLSDQGFHALACINVLASGGSALAAFVLLRAIAPNHLALDRLKGLLLLAAAYTLINPSLHFLFWYLFQPFTNTSVHDFVAMAVGDFAGAVLGSVLFVWGVRRTGLIHWIEKRALHKNEA